jgi:lysozyme family protein
MSADNFQQSLTFVWLPQNDGQPYHVTNHDSGAGTAWGVTQETWAEAVARGIVTGELKTAPKADCGTVLKALFWDVERCDDLHAGVDLVVFNMAMLSGVGREGLLLQHTLGVAQDGDIGAATIAAANARDPAGLIKTLTSQDETFFAGLASARWFLKGWDNRVAACEAVALAMLNLATA